MDGLVIGEHDGLMFHTLGQRKGLGIGGRKDSTDDPWYVVDKDVPRNALIAGTLCFTTRETPAEGRYTVKTRYRQPDIPCELIDIGDGKIKIIFDTEVAAVTPGQSAVLYDGEVCLGGGIIEERLKEV